MRLSSFALLSLGAASALSAQTTAPAPAPAKAAAAPKTGPDRIICRSEDTLGSRLGGKRTCRPAREWEQIANEERLNLDRRTSNTGPQ